MDKISVVIVTWNSGKVVGDCLVSLFDHAPRELFETILVDNDSTDPGYLQDLERRFGARVIRNSANLGFAKAVNIGARAATGTHILLLNPDMMFHSNPFPRLLSELEKNSRIGAIAPLLNDSEGRPQILDFYPTLPSIGQYLFYRSLLFKLGPVRKLALRLYHARVGTSGMYFVDQIPGAFLLFRRSLFGDAPVLNEAFFIWMEDVDFCTRLKRMGLKAAVVADESVSHIGGYSFRSWNERRRILMLNTSYLTYLEIHSGPVSYLAHTGIMALNALALRLIVPVYHMRKNPEFVREWKETWGELLHLILRRMAGHVRSGFKRHHKAG